MRLEEVEVDVCRLPSMWLRECDHDPRVRTEMADECVSVCVMVRKEGGGEAERGTDMRRDGPRIWTGEDPGEGEG